MLLWGAVNISVYQRPIDLENIEYSFQDVEKKIYYSLNAILYVVLFHLLLLTPYQSAWKMNLGFGKTSNYKLQVANGGLLFGAKYNFTIRRQRACDHLLFDFINAGDSSNSKFWDKVGPFTPPARQGSKVIAVSFLYQASAHRRQRIHHKTHEPIFSARRTSNWWFIFHSYGLLTFTLCTTLWVEPGDHDLRPMINQNMK